MPHSAKADERTNRVQIAALAALGLALLVAAALGTYQASLAKAHAARDVMPEGAPSAVQYLPGASAQIGTLREPLMVARRAAVRAGFDREDAPIDAFDRLRSVSGHDDEAASLLAQFWGRKAMVTENPLDRVLYALQARIVDDDESRRRTAESAIASLGPLRKARHVGGGTLLSCDPGTLVLRESSEVRVFNDETEASFDVPDRGGGAPLVGAGRMVTWARGTARVWDLDAAATAPMATLNLLPGEVPVAASRECVLTSHGRVWHMRDGVTRVADTRAGWLAGSITPTCDRVLLRSNGIASYRRHGNTWTGGPVKVPGKGVRAVVCATQAPRCALRDASGVTAVWGFASPVPRRLYEGIDCEPKSFSPDGKRLMCRESQDGVTVYSEDAAGDWTRTDVMLPGLDGASLQDDGTICGAAVDRPDVLFLAAQACAVPGPVERAWGAIRMMPSGNGAVFTYPPTGPSDSGSAEFFGLDAGGESLASASNAWFGQRKDERLLERDATNSAGEKSYDLAGLPFDPALALGDRQSVFSVQIDQAFFVESPEPTLVFEFSFMIGSPSAPGERLSGVARWNIRGNHSCGAPVSGAITNIAPGGDAVVIDGRIYKIGVCASDRGFESTDVTGVVAVGPGATEWMSRDGEALQLQAPQRPPTTVPTAERSVAPQVAFSPNGAQFLVRTAKSLCNWLIREDGTLDLDACRWSTGGWASDAAWAATDKTGKTVVVFDRTAEGAVLREFFGSHESELPRAAGADVACNAPPGTNASPLSVLRQWEERLGHRFKEQATSLQEAREMGSSAIVPTGAAGATQYP